MIQISASFQDQLILLATNFPSFAMSAANLWMPSAVFSVAIASWLTTVAEFLLVQFAEPLANNCTHRWILSNPTSYAATRYSGNA
jgi:hypothetical protein